MENDLMTEFGGFGELTKSAILADIGEQAKTPKKKSSKKATKSDNDSEPEPTLGVRFTPLPNTKLSAAEVKRYVKATATQKEDADYELKKVIIDKTSEYLQAFPYICEPIYTKWTKFEKKPYSYTKEQLKEISDDCVREINRPATVDLARTVLVAGMKGFVKANEFLNTGKDYRDADIVLAAELEKQEWNVLLQQLSIKWGLTKIPVEVLFLKKTWDVLDTVDKRNKMDRQTIHNASSARPATPVNRFKKL
jgi:hypothetical protein